MKPVEEAFASAGFRRVVLPGIVLTVALHPLIVHPLTALGSAYGAGVTILIIAEVLFFGLVVSSALQWVYYVYEGFRLPFLTSAAAKINERKVARLQSKRREIQKERFYDELNDDEKAKVTRIYEYLSDFPVRKREDGSIEHYAERPTRLGNVIATYELYAASRYGIDGIYYWRHLLNLASDSARKEFEEQYAFAESLVLTSFCGAVITLLNVGTLIGFAIGSWWRPLLSVEISPSHSTALAAFGVVVWYLFYRAALPAHRDAAAALRAIIDSVIGKFVEWARTATAPLPAEDRTKIDKLTEYLKALE